MLSKVKIGSFCSVLESEEKDGPPTGLSNLNDAQKLQYSLWKSLMKPYFESISKVKGNNFKK